jgi:hypothetical protein
MVHFVASSIAFRAKLQLQRNQTKRFKISDLTRFAYTLLHTDDESAMLDEVLLHTFSRLVHTSNATKNDHESTVKRLSVGTSGLCVHLGPDVVISLSLSPPPLSMASDKRFD